MNLKDKFQYPNINFIKTGANIKKLIERAGFSVKQIQEYMHLACPQPIYRWYSGKVMPSIHHLYALSQLLQVHMEELLVTDEVVFEKELWAKSIWAKCVWMSDSSEMMWNRQRRRLTLYATELR